VENSIGGVLDCTCFTIVNCRFGGNHIGLSHFNPLLRSVIGPLVYLTWALALLEFNQRRLKFVMDFILILHFVSYSKLHLQGYFRVLKFILASSSSHFKRLYVQ
jgi:hypothetical protein